MKPLRCVTTFLFFAGIVIPAFAQQNQTYNIPDSVWKKSSFAISFGAAFSTMPDCVYHFLYNQELGDYAPFIKSKSPTFNVAFDFTPPKSRTSVGIATSYGWFTDMPDGYQGTYLEKVSRLNIALRLLAYFCKKQSPEHMYGGIRLGMSLWKDNVPEGYPVARAYMYNAPETIKPSCQLVLGTRIGDYNGLGFILEVAFGSPYWFAGGFNIVSR